MTSTIIITNLTMSESLRKTINKISKKDLVSMTVTHIQFLSETHTLLNQIAQTASGDFKDNEDPLEWTLAQLGSSPNCF